MEDEKLTNQPEEINNVQKEEEKVVDEGKSAENSVVRQLREEVKKTNAELRKYKKAEEAKAEQDQLAKGEYDKIVADKEGKIAELNKRVQEMAVSQTLESELSEANIKPQWKALMQKEIKALLEFDDDGNPVNLSEAIAETKDTYPDAFKSSKASLPDSTTTVGDGAKSPMPASQWIQLSSAEKLKVKKERGVDHTK